MRDPTLWFEGTVVEMVDVLALRVRVADGDKVTSTHEPRDTPGGRITRGSNVPLPIERESIASVWAMEVYRGILHLAHLPRPEYSRRLVCWLVTLVLITNAGDSIEI